MSMYPVLALYIVEAESGDQAADTLRNSTAFDCVGAAPRIRHGEVIDFTSTPSEEDFTERLAHRIHNAIVLVRRQDREAERDET